MNNALPFPYRIQRRMPEHFRHRKVFYKAISPEHFHTLIDKVGLPFGYVVPT